MTCADACSMLLHFKYISVSSNESSRHANRGGAPIGAGAGGGS